MHQSAHWSGVRLVRIEHLAPQAPNPLLVGEFVPYCEQTRVRGSDAMPLSLRSYIVRRALLIPKWNIVQGAIVCLI